MQTNNAGASRPLSPHLSIYHFTVTMAMSIVHRITGGALYFGTLLLAWWLIAAASGPQAFSLVSGFLASWFGQIILFGYSWALFHHMLGGIRYLIWDSTALMEKGQRDRLAWASLVGSLVLTALVWIIVVTLR